MMPPALRARLETAADAVRAVAEDIKLVADAYTAGAGDPPPDAYTLGAFLGRSEERLFAALNTLEGAGTRGARGGST